MIDPPCILSTWRSQAAATLMTEKATKKGKHDNAVKGKRVKSPKRGRDEENDEGSEGERAGSSSGTRPGASSPRANKRTRVGMGGKSGGTDGNGFVAITEAAEDGASSAFLCTHQWRMFVLLAFSVVYTESSARSYEIIF